MTESQQTSNSLADSSKYPLPVPWEPQAGPFYYLF